MRRCPNPGCPFRVRHGFAAEFEDRVERCRSCDTPLSAASSEPSPAEPSAGAWSGLALRLIPTFGLIVLVASVAGLRVPGFELGGVSGALGASGDGVLDLAELTLTPALVSLAVASVLVELASHVYAGARQAVSHRARQLLSLGLAVLGLAGGGWLRHRAWAQAGLVDLPDLGLLLALHGAGLVLLLGLVAANERWGVGHGISVLVAALIGHHVHELAVGEDEVLELSLVLVALVGGGLVWLSRPARSTAVGRTALAEGRAEGLGLGLTVPSCGILPVLIVSWTAIALAWLELGSSVSAHLQLILVTALGVVAAWTFTGPARLVSRWRAAFPRAADDQLEREAKRLFRRALTRSVLLVLVVALLEQHELPALAVTLAAVLLDLLRELDHRLAHADLLALPTQAGLTSSVALREALALEGRPSLLQGHHHRSLYRWLGWWIPLRLLVHPDDHERACELRDWLLGRAPGD